MYALLHVVGGLLYAGQFFTAVFVSNTELKTIIWVSKRKNLSSGFGNNKDADQPAYSRSLISTFVIRFLESFICKLATGEISIF